MIPDSKIREIYKLDFDDYVDNLKPTPIPPKKIPVKKVCNKMILLKESKKDLVICLIFGIAKLRLLKRKILFIIIKLQTLNLVCLSILLLYKN
mgnify:CR=1 FL=1